MSKVWKIGSRYGSSGDILGIFWKYQIVFAGNNTERIISEVKKGHLFAVTCGHRVLAIAKALNDACPVEDLGLDEQDTSRFAGAAGVRVRLVALEKKDHFLYKERRSFVSANQIAGRVAELFEKSLNAFEIRSKVFCLHGGTTMLDQGIHSLLGGSVVRYVVPIYQRPYSWGEPQLRRFVEDLARGFREKSPVFAGPIQLSFPIPIDPQKGVFLQEIIDGQQRLTTLRLLARILGDGLGEDEYTKTIHGDWLETLVNEGEQHKSLIAALNVDPPALAEHPARATNRHLDNLAILQRILDDSGIQKTPSGDEDDRSIAYAEFFEYLCASIRLVAIETQAGLSKTLQVFNTINTAGLDLGGTDLFKIRFYEYLTRGIGQHDEAIFKSISELYAEIENRNKALGAPITSMAEILELFKYKTIASTNLSNSLWRDAAETFFDRFFDTALGVKEWAGYAEAKNIELRIKDIKTLIEARYRFHDVTLQFHAEADCCMHFIWWSRYGRFWVALPLFLAFSQQAVATRCVGDLTIALAKLFIVYSTVFGKRRNDLVSFLMDIMTSMGVRRNGRDSDISILLERIARKTAERKEAFSQAITGRLAWNVKGKNLVCRLSAMLAEIKTLSAHELVEKLFQQEIDIEHIQPANDRDGHKRQDVWDKWKTDLHSIGNLAVLERSINRRIGNLPVHEKTQGYNVSRFEIVNELGQCYQDVESFTLEKCQQRRSDELEKLITYLFGENPGSELPVPEDCIRLMRDPNDIPEEYDSGECQDCTERDCQFMPAVQEDEFWQGERETMYPEGMDDGEDVDSFIKCGNAYDDDKDCDDE